MSTDSDQVKQEIREHVWGLLERARAVHPPGGHSLIPDFVGAEAAADRLAMLPQWQAAHVLKANPDKAQLPVRVRGLAARKLVYMAVPRLADPFPFYVLDPTRLRAPLGRSVSSEGASTVAQKVGVDALRPVDVVICGSVAVNRDGVRIGKGGGYSDLEFALLVEAGLVGPETTLVTTVHSLQVVDGPLPETEHDFSVDLIVTPDEVIACGPPRRPEGLLWDHLDAEKIASIPVLAARAHEVG
jgi:5-formyltetrahydrofolate cyclo-ligase